MDERFKAKADQRRKMYEQLEDLTPEEQKRLQKYWDMDEHHEDFTTEERLDFEELKHKFFEKMIWYPYDEETLAWYEESAVDWDEDQWKEFRQEFLKIFITKELEVMRLCGRMPREICKYLADHWEDIMKEI